MTFGDRLRRARLSASVSNRELAEELDLTVHEVDLAERDRLSLSPDLVVRAADFLRADADSFVRAARSSPDGLDTSDRDIALHAAESWSLRDFS